MINSSIFRQLFLSYGSIFLIVLASLFGISSFELSQYLKASAYEEIHLSATTKRHDLESKLNQSLINLKSWASLVVMNDLLTEDTDLRITRTLETFKTLHHLPGHLYALSVSGKLIASDYQVTSPINFKMYQAAIQKKQHLIDKHPDPVTHKPIIALWQPVYADFGSESPIGYLVMTYPWQEIESLLNMSAFETYILLYNHTNDNILKDKQIPSRLSEKLLKISIPATASQQKTIAPEITFDDENYFFINLENTAATPLTNLWRWVSLADTSRFYTPAQHILNISLIIGGITVLLALLVIFITSRKISQPIQTLTRTAVEIASTLDLSKRVPITGNNEIFQLGTAFNDMCLKLEKAWAGKKRITQELQKINHSLEQKVAERTDHLAWQATHDPLTALPNRALLSERLEQAIARSQRNQHMLAVMFIDLDGFKAINDNFGHETGDHLLTELAKRFLSIIRDPDTIARLGGDEFVILMQIDKPDNLTAPLEHIVKLINQPVVTESAQLNVSPSIGVTIFPDDPSDSEALIRHADQAMYEAKQKGRNQVQFFNTEMDNKIHSELNLRREIKIALQSDQFVLHYQPQIHLSTDMITGAEALIRWNHPNKGLIFPDEFLPAIEDSDLMIKLGRWVIQHACRQLHEWNKQGVTLKISVNIACCHIQHPDFFNELVVFLEAYPDVKPEQLVLEITESAAIKDFDTAKYILQSCHDYDVHIALDDFGTGFSSLTYLRQLPISFIKIDKSFVIDMLKDPEDMAIVKGTIGLAENFKQLIIAEGVETQEHSDELKIMNCTFGQGYGIAKPLSSDDFMIWIKSQPYRQNIRLFDHSTVFSQ